MKNWQDRREKRGYYLSCNLAGLDECEKGQKDPDGKLLFKSGTITKGWVNKGTMPFQSRCKRRNGAVGISRQKMTQFLVQN